MTIEILNRWTGAVLYSSATAQTIAEAVQEARVARADLSRADLSGAYLSRANLSGADLSGADLSRANLSGADLSRADLSRADLSGAYLSRADLSGADLSGADLSGAYLSGAEGINPNRVDSLRFLREQPGAIRAYKLVDKDLRSPITSAPKLTYTIGEVIEAQDANTNESEQCAAGINLATLDWCLRKWKPGYRILVVEFTAADIAAIPLGTDGKFRVRRCLVVREKPVEEWGDRPWMPATESEGKVKP